MGSGEADGRTYTIRGDDLDYSRLCAQPGCGWHVFGADRCTDHGGGGFGMEYRTDAHGVAQYRMKDSARDGQGQTL